MRLSGFILPCLLALWLASVISCEVTPYQYVPQEKPPVPVDTLSADDTTGAGTDTLSGGGGTVADQDSTAFDDGGGESGGDEGGDDGGGESGGDEGGDDGGGESGGDEGDDDRLGWFELPFINDADRNGIDDRDGNLYYASHSFSSGKKEMRNYTVCYSAAHHCPLWVAAPRHDCYVGSSGRSNAYRQDPSIPSEVQYNSKTTGGNCNKGHMLGSAERTCSSEANRQVFYYSNIAPQLSAGYNTGGGGWNLLEDWVDTQVCRDTLYEVVGCYFDSYTDGYGFSSSPRTISFGGRSDVDVPTMFYYVLLRTRKGNSGKSVKDCSASELQCAAFVRAHNNSLKGRKPSRSEMMSVSELEKITGITYFPNVPDAPKTDFSASDWGL